MELVPWDIRSSGCSCARNAARSKFLQSTVHCCVYASAGVFKYSPDFYRPFAFPASPDINTAGYFTTLVFIQFRYTLT